MALVLCAALQSLSTDKISGTQYSVNLLHYIMTCFESRLMLAKTVAHRFSLPTSPALSPVIQSYMVTGADYQVSGYSRSGSSQVWDCIHYYTRL